jgi:hypothetical protein
MAGSPRQSDPYGRRVTDMVPAPEFDSTLCGTFSFDCFAQPNIGQTLGPLREVVMWRLQYRNFGDYETLVGNLVTDLGGTGRGSIYWFELRSASGSPSSPFQTGIFSPNDGDNRWMGSIAMNGATSAWAIPYQATQNSPLCGTQCAWPRILWAQCEQNEASSREETVNPGHLGGVTIAP